MIDICLLERQGGGGVGRGRGEKGESERGGVVYKRVGWRGEVGTGGKGGQGLRGAYERWSKIFFPPSEIGKGIAAINSTLSSLSLPSPLSPSHLGLLILPSHFHQRLKPLHTSVQHHYAKVEERGINKEEEMGKRGRDVCGEGE